jgi:hypothetical protein
MRGRRLEKPEAYSLKYVEDFFEPRTTQMPADRLPQQNGMTRTGSQCPSVDACQLVGTVHRHLADPLR